MKIRKRTLKISGQTIFFNSYNFVALKNPRSDIRLLDCMPRLDVLVVYKIQHSRRARGPRIMFCKIMKNYPNSLTCSKWTKFSLFSWHYKWRHKAVKKRKMVVPSTNTKKRWEYRIRMTYILDNGNAIVLFEFFKWPHRTTLNDSTFSFFTKVNFHKRIGK